MFAVEELHRIRADVEKSLGSSYYSLHSMFINRRQDRIEFYVVRADSKHNPVPCDSSDLEYVSDHLNANEFADDIDFDSFVSPIDDTDDPPAENALKFILYM